MKQSDLPIPEPCGVSSEAMRASGSGRRYCSSCKQTVFDLSALPEKQAKELLRRRRGELCVEYWTDEDGVIQFAKPPPRTTFRTAAAVALPLIAAACSHEELPEDGTVEVVETPRTPAAAPAPPPAGSAPVEPEADAAAEQCPPEDVTPPTKARNVRHFRGKPARGSPL